MDRSKEIEGRQRERMGKREKGRRAVQNSSVETVHRGGWKGIKDPGRVSGMVEGETLR